MPPKLSNSFFIIVCFGIYPPGGFIPIINFHYCKSKFWLIGYLLSLVKVTYRVLDCHHVSGLVSILNPLRRMLVLI